MARQENITLPEFQQKYGDEEPAGSIYRSENSAPQWGSGPFSTINSSRASANHRFNGVLNQCIRIKSTKKEQELRCLDNYW